MLPQKYICLLMLMFSVLFVQVGDMSEQHILMRLRSVGM